MLNSLETPGFFTHSDITQLQTLKLPVDNGRLSFAALMLAPVVELSVFDRITTLPEFEAIEKYIDTLECELELATRADLETIGTDMGALPIVRGTWRPADFHFARNILGELLERMPDTEAHTVRSAISKALLAVSQAGGAHLISVHVVEAGTKPLILDIIHSLKLETTADGLNLLGKSGT